MYTRIVYSNELMYTRIILTITAYFFNGNDTKYYKLELSPNKSELYIYIYIYTYIHTHTHTKKEKNRPTHGLHWVLA